MSYPSVQVASTQREHLPLRKEELSDLIPPWVKECRVKSLTFVASDKHSICPRKKSAHRGDCEVKEPTMNKFIHSVFLDTQCNLYLTVAPVYLQILYNFSVDKKTLGASDIGDEETVGRGRVDS